MFLKCLIFVNFLIIWGHFLQSKKTGFSGFRVKALHTWSVRLGSTTLTKLTAQVRRPRPYNPLPKEAGEMKNFFRVNALEVEPYELLLPPQTSISYDTKRTKDLMNRLRKNLGEVVDMLEDFLGEK